MTCSRDDPERQPRNVPAGSAKTRREPELPWQSVIRYRCADCNAAGFEMHIEVLLTYNQAASGIAS